MGENTPRPHGLEPTPGLTCPKCNGVEVAKLPSNGISPDPGYRCLSCGVRLRGMTFTYVLVIFLGLGLLTLAFGVLKPFGDDRDAQMQNYVIYSSPICLLVVAYAVRELLRPKPKRLAP